MLKVRDIEILKPTVPGRCLAALPVTFLSAVSMTLILWLLNGATLLVFAHDASEQSLKQWLLLRFIMSAMLVFIFLGGLKFVHLVEQDLNNIASRLDLKTPQPISFNASLGISIIGVFAGMALGMIIDGPLIFLKKAVTTSLIPSMTLMFLVGPWISLQFVVSRHQVKWLIAATEKLDVNLLRMETAEAFSHPPLRITVLIIVGLCFGPTIIILDLQHAALGYFFTALALFGGAILLAPFLRPVSLLSRKISAAKNHELSLIDRYYAGEASSLSETSIGQFASDPSLADVLAYEQRVRTTWNIPIDQRFRKWLVLGVAPPFAWVLAASVENMLF